MAKTKFNTNLGQSFQEDNWNHFMKMNCKLPMEWQRKFIIQDKFEMGNKKKILAITFTPDMYFPTKKFFIDFKGMITNEYKIKKKMLQYVYDIDGLEVCECPKYLLNAKGMRYATPEFLEQFKKAKKALGILMQVKDYDVPKIVKKVEEKYIIQYNTEYLYWYLIKK